MCQGLTHNGVRLDWKGVKETNDVVEMVESGAAALRVLDHETRNPRPHASHAQHRQRWRDALEKSLPRGEFPDLVSFLAVV